MADTAPTTPPPPAAASGWGPKGKVREPVAVIVFSIITLGIYFLVWSYKVFKENKDFSGAGVGGGIGLLLAEIGTIYERTGREKPVSGVTGFWNLIPLIGWIIWIVKVQGAMNRLYE
jgi:Domain of unknown function (DUF4234)